MIQYFNKAIKPLNDELRQQLGLRKRSRKIAVTYIGDRGSFAVMNMDYKQGKELVYVEQITFAEALRWRPF